MMSDIQSLFSWSSHLGPLQVSYHAEIHKRLLEISEIQLATGCTKPGRSTGILSMYQNLCIQFGSVPGSGFSVSQFALSGVSACQLQFGDQDQSCSTSVIRCGDGVGPPFSLEARHSSEWCRLERLRPQIIFLLLVSTTASDLSHLFPTPAAIYSDRRLELVGLEMTGPLLSPTIQ
jgi:hypothetical protein